MRRFEVTVALLIQVERQEGSRNTNEWRIHHFSSKHERGGRFLSRLCKNVFQRDVSPVLD